MERMYYSAMAASAVWDARRRIPLASDNANTRTSPIQTERTLTAYRVSRPSRAFIGLTVFLYLPLGCLLDLVIAPDGQTPWGYSLVWSHSALFSIQVSPQTRSAIW
jgi:hypothetical protein